MQSFSHSAKNRLRGGACFSSHFHCARLIPSTRNPMTQAEKKRLSAVLQATEYLFLENLALKLVLEHRGVTNWQKLVDHLLADKEILGGVRLTFRDLSREIEASTDPAAALEAFLGKIPAKKTTQ